jgi:hypothetical protein
VEGHRTIREAIARVKVAVGGSERICGAGGEKAGLPRCLKKEAAILKC